MAYSLINKQSYQIVCFILACAGNCQKCEDADVHGVCKNCDARFHLLAKEIKCERKYLTYSLMFPRNPVLVCAIYLMRPSSYKAGNTVRVCTVCGVAPSEQLRHIQWQMITRG